MAASSMFLGRLTCDLCGKDGFNMEALREHTIKEHVEKSASCPFCDLGQVTRADMLNHVNTVHLDQMEEEKRMEEEQIGSALEEALNSIKKPRRYSFLFGFRGKGSKQTPKTPKHDGAFSNLKKKLSFGLFGKSDSDSDDVETPAKISGHKCMMCGYTALTPTELQYHLNKLHLDSPRRSTSASFYFANFKYICPICERRYKTENELEHHVNMAHLDVTSPNLPPFPPSPEILGCFVCGRPDFENNEERVAHIDEHFEAAAASGSKEQQEGLARAIDRCERETRRIQEQREFRRLQIQYGMDSTGNFSEQSIYMMQKAVSAGEMSITTFNERQIELRLSENYGIDDGSTRTLDLMPKIKVFSEFTTNIKHSYFCSACDHFASTYGDRGWGCGYRNLQMLLSSLLYKPRFFGVLTNPINYSGGLFSFSHGVFARTVIPSITKLQRHIEWAWDQGFDKQGKEQIGKLSNTRKWIGASEIYTVMSSLRFRCELLDFHQPTDTDGTHPEMFTWFLNYFKDRTDFVPPVYLQHQGHSRTVIGIEQYQDGHLALILFDPSHSPRQLDALKSTQTGVQGMRLLRRGVSAMRARQYQIVVVRDLMKGDKEFEDSKHMFSTRVPDPK